eukprot:5743828-Prymnesium_polylepis.1
MRHALVPRRARTQWTDAVSERSNAASAALAPRLMSLEAKASRHRAADTAAIQQRYSNDTADTAEIH